MDHHESFVMENRQDIYELVAKYFAGEALPQEAMAMDDWRTASPANASAFVGFAKLYQQQQQPDQQNGWQQIMKTINPPAKKITLYRKFVIAASIIGLLVTATLFIINRKNDSEGPIVYETKETPNEIKLPDNSLILMQANSILTVSNKFGQANRHLTLNGSATFNVLHDAAKPFIVDMENLHIRDIGTIFSITTVSKDSVQVKVEEGEVQVYDDAGKTVNLAAGQQIIYLRSAKEFVPAAKQQLPVKKDTITIPEKPGKEQPMVNIGITMAEAELIIGQPVKQVRKDPSSGQFQAIADQNNNLYYTITNHPDTVLAHNHYSGTFNNNAGAAIMESMLKYKCEAFYQTDQLKFYKIMFRKKSITCTIWIDKLKSTVSINELIKKAKRAAAAIR